MAKYKFRLEQKVKFCLIRRGNGQISFEYGDGVVSDIDGRGDVVEIDTSNGELVDIELFGKKNVWIQPLEK